MKRKTLFLTTILIGACLYITSCASMRVHGDDPISRATSITQLMIDGHTKDSYIKIYQEEMPQARSRMEILSLKATQNPQVYLTIADEVDKWIQLNNNIEILSLKYPSGLTGKKLNATFLYKDYTQLKTTSTDYASDYYFQKALTIYENTSLTPLAKRPALENLKKAAKYSSKNNAQINPIGADISYLIADTEKKSTNLDTLLDAQDMFFQATTWIPEYKDSSVQIELLNVKIAQKYIALGDFEFNKNNYSSFRKALVEYNNAKKYIEESAQEKITQTNNKLTVKVAYLYGNDSFTRYDETKILEALQKKLDAHTMGPAYIELDFIPVYRKISTILLASDEYSNYDFIFIPNDDYGKVHEDIDNFQETKTFSEKQIGDITYQGVVYNRSKDVSVYYLCQYDLYDMRSNTKRLIKSWTEKQAEQTKSFSKFSYEGDEQAIPNNFREGMTYSSGFWPTYFPDFNEHNYTYDMLSTNYDKLNEVGIEFAEILRNLTYIN